MPPLPPAAQTLKVEQFWSDEADPTAVTILHFRYTGGPPSSAQCASMAGEISGNAGATFASLLTTGSHVGACQVTDLTSATSGQGSGGGLTVGTRTGAPLSPGTAALVNFSIARRYRGGKPRVYLPLGTATDNNAGQWSSSFLTALATAWATFVTDCLGSGVGCAISQHVSVSYVSGGVRRVTPEIDPIVNYTYPSLFASQRRRNRNQ